MLEDAHLPLVTDTFKETVLEEGRILQPVVSATALEDAGLPPYHGRFQRDLGLRKV